MIFNLEGNSNTFFNRICNIGSLRNFIFCVYNSEKRVNEVIKAILNGLAIFLVGIMIYSCSCLSCGKSDYMIQVPDSIFSKANKFIISAVGKDFFDKYIHPDYINSRSFNGSYELHYIFRMLEHDYVDEIIYFAVDSSGKVLDKYDIIGIPNCRDEPESCEFNIDRSKVLEIARSEGVSEGVRDWEVSFRWSSELGMYIWHILSTTSEMASEKSYKADGEEMMISPYDGTVLKFRKWSIK